MAGPPANHPKYLLDLHKWQVRLYEACWDEAGSELRDSGYGAISYAWGKWRQRGGTSAGRSGYPSFDIGTDKDTGAALSWTFPVVNTIRNNKKDPNREQFTIATAKTALEALGKRFVWWDWACIPQNLDEKSGPILVEDGQREMNKMRFVYPVCRSGMIWAHHLDWAAASPLKTAIQACFKYASASEHLVGNVQEVVDALEEAHLAEEWFRSLWCFQEGVLFRHADRSEMHSCFFLDKHGRPLTVGSSYSASSSSSGLWAASVSLAHTIKRYIPLVEMRHLDHKGDLQDLVEVASEIVKVITGALEKCAEDPPAYEAAQPTGEPLTWAFDQWCMDPAFEQPARGMADRLMETGMAFMVSQHPLSLLNARLGRYPQARTTDMDIEVNTVIGALDISVEEYQTEWQTLIVADQKLSATDKSIKARELVFMREGMLSELFKHYQWRMLLLATARREHTRDLTGIWSELVKVPRNRAASSTTPFTALEHALNRGSLPERFFPPPLLTSEGVGGQGDKCKVPGCIPEGQFALPKLEYLRDSGVLLLKKMDPAGCSGYKLFQLDGYQQPLWSKCMLYSQVLRGGGTGTFIPNFQLVEWDERSSVFGKNIVLVPLENLSGGPESWRKARLRCIVLAGYGDAEELGYPELPSNNNRVRKAAMFVGVVDLEGPDGTDSGMPLDRGNLELDEDLALY